MALADRLQYARERSGLTQSQAKDRTGIGDSSLSEFENGRREPSLAQLHALAQAYHRSISFFLAQEEPAPEVVLWRKRPGDPTEDIEGRFRQLCEQYHNLEVWCDDRARSALPSYNADSANFEYSDAESLAKKVRDDLQLGDRPGPVLLRVLEEVCGVKVFHLAFDPTGAAACALGESFGAAVLLNRKNVRWRRNHDLAHELFHLLTWSAFPKLPDSATPSAREEQLATCFAANLLMPPKVTRAAVGRRISEGMVSYPDLFDIAREFDVSVESLLWRLHILYGRGPDAKELTEQEIERARAFAPSLEDREKEEPPTWPHRYHDLAVKALRQGEISIGRFAEYLSITRQQAMKYIEQETPHPGYATIVRWVGQQAMKYTEQETSDGEEVRVAPA